MIAATPKNALDKVKSHIQENKKVYIVGGVCLVVGLAGGALIVKAHQPPPIKVQPKINQVLSWKPEAKLEVYIEALGDPGNIIQDTTTGTIYASQRQAADALGVDPSSVSRHLAGKFPDVKGHILSNLGKAYVPSIAE
ncbi:membrane protein [Gordonia Phage Odesza]|uniref:Membrane protein n=1 Tax=Gordonia Phage Odesza TaxID=2656527 RepID=A0A649VC84_9CAUD|nr:membrane protein [Gordonia Phage Odesza]